MLETLLDLVNVLDILQMIVASHLRRNLSKERKKEEAEIASIVRNLCDSAIAKAVRQIAVLDRVR